MSRKHFQMLADYMAQSKPLYRSHNCYVQAVERLATKLADENDRFDYAKFIAACKV